jgi:hypothetical protein
MSIGTSSISWSCTKKSKIAKRIEWCTKTKISMCLSLGPVPKTPWSFVATLEAATRLLRSARENLPGHRCLQGSSKKNSHNLPAEFASQQDGRRPGPRWLDRHLDISGLSGPTTKEPVKGCIQCRELCGPTTKEPVKGSIQCMELCVTLARKVNLLKIVLIHGLQRSRTS